MIALAISHFQIFADSETINESGVGIAGLRRF